MRKEMHEDIPFQEAVKAQMSERASRADQLLEQKWGKTPQLGEGIQAIADKDINKARNLIYTLENQERHLQNLTETQISTAFQTTPENVMRIVRLGYPNSVRGELFLEWSMETARDSIYYLSPKYGKTKRGATAGDVTHESDAYLYASEIEEQVVGTGDGTATVFTGTLAPAPLRQYAVRLFSGGFPVAIDDGAGNLVGADITAGTVDYTTGAISITFATAPTAGFDVMAQFYLLSEDSSLYDEIGSVELQLKDYQFRVKPYPLYAS